VVEANVVLNHTSSQKNQSNSLALTEAESSPGVNWSYQLRLAVDVQPARVGDLALFGQLSLKPPDMR
jgi:hypothetical protein